MQPPAPACHAWAYCCSCQTTSSSSMTSQARRTSSTTSSCVCRPSRACLCRMSELTDKQLDLCWFLHAAQSACLTDKQRARAGLGRAGSPSARKDSWDPCGPLCDAQTACVIVKQRPRAGFGFPFEDAVHQKNTECLHMASSSQISYSTKAPPRVSSRSMRSGTSPRTQKTSPPTTCPWSLTTQHDWKTPGS